MLLISKATLYTEYNGIKVYTWKRRDGISLGRYIFTPYAAPTPIDAPYVQHFIKHEYGHCCQSQKLGWFYLLIIGLPSIIWCNCFEAYRKKYNISYYSFYTESWANQLGGVEEEA